MMKIELGEEIFEMFNIIQKRLLQSISTDYVSYPEPISVLIKIFVWMIIHRFFHT